MIGVPPFGAVLVRRDKYDDAEAEQSNDVNAGRFVDFALNCRLGWMDTCFLAEPLRQSTDFTLEPTAECSKAKVVRGE